jgi:hypothetical protein
LFTLKAHALNQQKQPSLSNRHTNWDHFRQLINKRITLNVSHKTKEDIEAAVKFLNDAIPRADWNTAPEEEKRANTHTKTEFTEYSLRNATKKIKHVKKSSPLRTSHETWARSNIKKAHTFTEHLAKVFLLHPSENKIKEEEALIQLLETPTNSFHQ